MAFFNNTDDDDKEGFYDSFEEEVEKPKEPVYKPDDPRYWDKEPDPWEHLRPSRFKKMIILGCAIVLLALFVWLSCRLVFGPAVDDAVQYGYVDHVEQRGAIFKTYEGNLLPYKNLHDTTRAYDADFVFSASEPIGRVLRSYQNSGKPLRVEYRTYRYALPWQGESRTVIVRVDTVHPDSILPAAYRNNLPYTAPTPVTESAPAAQ